MARAISSHSTATNVRRGRRFGSRLARSQADRYVDTGGQATRQHQIVVLDANASVESAPMRAEADTCRTDVVPRLQAVGWDDGPHSIAERSTLGSQFIGNCGATRPEAFTRWKRQSASSSTWHNPGHLVRMDQDCGRDSGRVAARFAQRTLNLVNISQGRQTVPVSAMPMDR